jgi:hypothetical protein
MSAQLSMFSPETSSDSAVCYHLDLTVTCADCGAELEFVGMPNGCSFYLPTVSIDRKTARFPMVRAGESVPAGMPGFGVRHIQVEEKSSPVQ